MKIIYEEKIDPQDPGFESVDYHLQLASFMHTALLDSIENQAKGEYFFAGFAQCYNQFLELFSRVVKPLLTRCDQLDHTQQIDLANYLYTIVWIKIKSSDTRHLNALTPTIGDELLPDNRQYRDDDSWRFKIRYISALRFGQPGMGSVKPSSTAPDFDETCEPFFTLLQSIPVTEDVLRLQSRCYLLKKSWQADNTHKDEKIELIKKIILVLTRLVNPTVFESTVLRENQTDLRDRLLDQEHNQEFSTENIEAIESYLDLNPVYHYKPMLQETFQLQARHYLCKKTATSKITLFRALNKALEYLSDFLQSDRYPAIHGGNIVPMILEAPDEALKCYEALNRLVCHENMPIRQQHSEGGDDGEEKDECTALAQSLNSRMLYDFAMSVFSIQSRKHAAITYDFLDLVTRAVLKRDAYHIIRSSLTKQPVINTSLEMQWRVILKSIHDVCHFILSHTSQLPDRLNFISLFHERKYTRALTALMSSPIYCSMLNLSVEMTPWWIHVDQYPDLVNPRDPNKLLASLRSQIELLDLKISRMTAIAVNTRHPRRELTCGVASGSFFAEKKRKIQEEETVEKRCKEEKRDIQRLG